MRLSGTPLWAVLAVVLSVAGCTKGENDVSTRVQHPEPASRTGDLGITDQVPAPASTLEIRIVPERPTLEHDLEASVGGAVTQVRWHWARNGRPVDGADGARLPRSLFGRGDTISVTASVDGREVSAQAVIGNSIPRVKSVVFTPARINRGVDITATPRAMDADGDEVRFKYQWLVNGREIVMNDLPVLKGDRFRRGDQVSVRVIPFDGRDEGEPYETRPLEIANAPPRFVSTPPLSFEGHVYAYQATANDPDDDRLTYALIASPPGMSIEDSTGSLHWKIGSDASGAHTIEIAARDQHGLEAVQKFSLTISVPTGAGNPAEKR